LVGRTLSGTEGFVVGRKEERFSGRIQGFAHIESDTRMRVIAGSGAALSWQKTAKKRAEDGKESKKAELQRQQEGGTPGKRKVEDWACGQLRDPAPRS